MIGIPGFRRRARQFDYQPRYYDPEKEAREQRRREVLGGEAQTPGGEDKKYVPGAYIHQARVNRVTAARDNRGRKRRSVIRTVLVLVMLLLAAYLIVYVF